MGVELVMVLGVGGAREGAKCGGGASEVLGVG